MAPEVGSSVAVSITRTGPMGPLRVGVVGILCEDCGISAPVACPRVVAAPSFWDGAVPPCEPAACSILTGPFAFPAGCVPSFSRGPGEFCSFSPSRSAGRFQLCFPPRAAGRLAPACRGAPASWKTLQFTNRRIWTFITIPSARNMNSTDEPP